MAKRKTYIYQFAVVQGEIQLIARADGNLYNIERILGVVKVKGKKELFEKVEIKDRLSGFAGIFLTERKNLNFDVISHFITNFSNGVRTVQSHPYTDDLYDDELLGDLGIKVLNYKHFYPMSGGMHDVFYPAKDVTEDLLRELERRTQIAIQDEETWNLCREADRRNVPIFESI